MEISLKELLEAGCHFGHQTVRWNPKMRPYIFSAREGVHIFDLAKTKEGLIEAISTIQNIVDNEGTVLFIASKRQAKDIVSESAKKIGMPYVTQRWLGGMITNWDQVKKSIDKLADMKQKRESGEYKSFTKKEQLLIDREIAKFEKFLGGISSMKVLPQAVFIIDSKRESAAVNEANRVGIPIIAMVDSNGDPDMIEHVIPVNDDAVSSIKLIMDKIVLGVEEKRNKGKQPKEKKEDAKEDKKE